ncbi:MULTISPECIES: hypothetical protein [Chryseobacterium]|uniref:Uncharacterized protein n=1 Tax=Chryseobacterium indoltheticum TaxID=254 RepID=A0A381FCX5_9FLAO|nr:MULTISPECIES: hypothetical protein [Chryseobacterium]SIQ94105.1 hypothetical protein SAMN05421682_11099 [Chryseobacterium indoltheticum]SUX43932.1 Uncharacterised protein [Chryseobacterium indoltheticum]
MEDKTNYFTRTLICIFSICLALMVAYNYLYVEPIGAIKDGNLIIIFLILILILSESFDSFSIGKIISISRKLKEKNDEVEKLESKNSQLLSQVISLTTNQNQVQSSKQIFGDYYERPKKQKKIDNEKVVRELLDRIGTSIVISDLESSIKKEIIQQGLEISTETETVLIRHLAGTQLLMEFLRIDKYIFGSQLNLLKELAEIKPEGYTKNEIEEYFESVKQSFPNSFNNWDVKKYLGFLFSSILITKNDEKIHLTNFGQEYIDWVAENRANDYRSL